MKKYILLTATLIAALAANAQVNDLPIIGNRFTGGIDIGLSLPSGDFATNAAHASDIGNAGSAKTGFYYDIYAGVRLISVLGVMAEFGGNSNSFNTGGLSSSGISASASGGYNISEYLIGPYISLHFSKIKIEGKLLAGLLSSNYPTLTTSSYGTSVVDAFQTGNGFGYCLGGKIKYMMLKGLLGIGVGLNYVSSDVNYKGPQTVYPPVGTPTSNQISTKMTIGLIQPTIGASLDI